jgi:3-deoxy-manno-octulosonate cytidylyltransferase (CMP-KDO synthetase)
MSNVRFSPLVLIPARMTATRLPRKPLADIHGEAMIVQVWRRAVEADIGPVVVAADDERIIAAVRAVGGVAVMTDPDHPSGSDRIFEALGRFDPDGRHDVVVNVQGDLPTIDPRVIRASLAPLEDPDVDVATLTAVITREAEMTASHVVKIVGSPIGETRLRALYFTRATAPWGEGPLYHHIGLSPRRAGALRDADAVAAGAARETRAAAGARGRHADRRRDRRHGAARRRHPRGPGARPRASRPSRLIRYDREGPTDDRPQEDRVPG